jgi:hypothetical protein
MTECFGEYMGRHVGRSDRRPWDRERLRKHHRPYIEKYATAAELKEADSARTRRCLAALRRYAARYFGADTDAMAQLALEELRRSRPTGAIPIYGPVASLSAPVGPVASQLVLVWRLNPPAHWGKRDTVRDSAKRTLNRHTASGRKLADDGVYYFTGFD